MINQLKVYNVGEKIRVGSPHDGGYVLPKQMLEDSECLFSYGINDDITFDEHYIQLTNKKVYGYDHTIEGIPTKYPELFTWYKKGLSGTPTEETDNFLNHYKKLGISGRVLLKVDVEECEYEWLQNTDIQKLANATTCIVLEVHWLHDYEFRKKFINCITELNKYFYLCHIHGNNYGPIFDDLEGYSIPSVLELTFVPKEIVTEVSLSTETFPTTLDTPNNPDDPDYDLSFIKLFNTIKTFKDLKDRKWEGDGIPKWIFKTGPHKVGNLPETYRHLFLDILKNNPGYELFYFSDEDCMISIHHHYGEEYFRLHQKLIPTAYQADFWRYLILKQYGGCYGDFSQIPLFPYDKITEGFDRVFARDDPSPKSFLYNAVMCVKPNDDVVNRAIDISVHNIRTNNHDTHALGIVGPKVLGQTFIDRGYNKNSNSSEIYVGEYNGSNVLRHLPQGGLVKDYLDTSVFVTKIENHYAVVYANGKKHYGELWHSRQVFR